ncbi:hypothetical protein FKR81_29095 [Lentzea tibetensis]|uniref:Peptidase inhibitor family I36 n=1 Tax=Lentzea tibetensis TaxID=2591470 RepID=A0A563EM39_9PSEU|nr:peptidase inhibitor family I36 protein [Lentzea tibetensis]TWP48346.1 hypothetical protein FKR81_29095 [Lentzea tibetensis]
MKRFFMAAAAVAAVFSIGAAAPAAAAPHSEDKVLTSTVAADDVSAMAVSCSNLYWCIWRDPNATNNNYRYTWFGSDGNYANNYWSGVTVSNKASGVWNQGDRQFVVIFDGPDYTGNWACVPANTHIPDLRNAATGDTPVGWWNERISSHKWSNTCTR